MADDPKLIFLVEDDDKLRMSLKDYLESKGFEVNPIKNGFDALMFKYIVPDLIISDIRMPKMNGITLMHGLKKKEKTKDIPVIFMSGFREDHVMEEAKTLGATGFLLKPFPLNELDKLIDRAFGKSV